MSTYSGGMRRRLDLGAGLVGRPKIPFLDEPTTGLDPRSRNGAWAIVRELVAAGTSILLSTQYLDEADELADLVAVVDHGRLIAEGSSDEFKSTLGGDIVEFQLADPADLPTATAAIGAAATQLGSGDPYAQCPGPRRLRRSAAGSTSAQRRRHRGQWTLPAPPVARRRLPVTEQPVTMVVDARQLALGIDGHGAVWKVLLWSAALLTVFIPVAMLQYRRRGA